MIGYWEERYNKQCVAKCSRSITYAANQESTDLINETYMDEVPLRFMGQDVSRQQPLSID